MSLKGSSYKLEIVYKVIENMIEGDGRQSKDVGRGWDFDPDVYIHRVYRCVKLTEMEISQESLEYIYKKRSEWFENLKIFDEFFSYGEGPKFPINVPSVLSEKKDGIILETEEFLGEFRNTYRAPTKEDYKLQMEDQGIYYCKYHNGIRGKYISQISKSKKVSLSEHKRYSRYGYEHFELTERKCMEEYEYVLYEFLSKKFEHFFPKKMWDGRYMPTDGFVHSSGDEKEKNSDGGDFANALKKAFSEKNPE